MMNTKEASLENVKFHAIFQTRIISRQAYGKREAYLVSGVPVKMGFRVARVFG